jgi:predicted ATP-binding protein involved in virulence
MIKNLEIEGLRGFASRGILAPALPDGSEGSGLTVITGPNNSGKTTIIEAFRMFASVNADPSFHVGMRNARTDAVDLALSIDDEIFTIKSRSPGKSETVYPVKTPIIPYVVPSRRQFAPFFSKNHPSERDTFARNFSSHSQIRSASLDYFDGRIFDLERDQSAYNEVLK